ncbi:MAG: type II toxin-antitoxin system VapC family toxin [Propionibacteriaceae bacterium]|nr:type II toxin-antitoxin system VapC family toxin [Propionibacteriaceae bacterium]
MSLVVDTSVTLSWLFADEVSPETEALLDRVRDESGMVPSLWQYEVSNALLMAVRQGRLVEADATHILTLLRGINLQVNHSPIDLKRVFALAVAHQLTAYDAAYLDLAMVWGVPLATLDRSLAQAGAAVGVEVLPRVAG